MGILNCVFTLFLIIGVQSLGILSTDNDNSAYSSSDDDVAAAFSKAKISPDHIPVPPNQLLHVVFPGGHVVDLGNKMSPDEAEVSPTVCYDADPDSYYTLFMVDFDAVYPDFLRTPGLLHWGVGNIKGSDVSSGIVFAPYFPVTTPPGSAPHRYTQLVYRQNGKVDYGLGDVIAASVAERLTFDLQSFVTKHNLGNPQFGNFFSGHPLESAVIND